MIKEWIDSYNPSNHDEASQALREILQEVTLAGLQRGGFFEKAAFFGGTALRIFHGLDRFSEDLDFSLLEADAQFSFEPYLENIIREFTAIGVEVDIQDKQKTKQSYINSAFLKADTSWHELTLKNIIPQERPSGLNAAIRIKLEVDRQPPLGFETEEKLLLRPFSFYTKCFVLPDLFAGKMHALLFRKWIKRVKGRDWYDMEWYIRKGVPLNLHHLALRAYDSGDWETKRMTQEEFRKLLEAKIDSVSLDNVRADVVPFVRNSDSLKIWSTKYFHDLADRIKFA